MNVTVNSEGHQSHFDLSRWSLADLGIDPSEPSMKALLSEIDRSAAAFENYRSRLNPELSFAEFSSILKDYEQLSITANRLVGFANLFFYEDTQNQSALKLKSQVDQAFADISNRIVFFELWFKALDPDSAGKFLNASGDLRYFLETLRMFQPYTLSENEEKIITLKDVNGIEAMMGLYEMITNRFSFELEVDGEKKTLTRDALMAYVRSPSADLRERIYRELYRVYSDQSTILAQIYTHRVLDWHSEGINLRGFTSPIAARNLMNDVPDHAVETLLQVCRQNASLFQRYFRMKASWLGLEKLRRYDIYAPLSQSQKEYSFSKAVDLVISSFEDFTPVAAEKALNVLQQNHLDSELRPGKRGGAFCYSILPELTPWVLVNFAGKARDVATLAHELGHAIHSQLASGHSYLTFSPSLPLAETASVFSEMLLTERLLQNESDPATRRELLAHAVDDAYATILRQAYFTIFEQEAHQLIQQGASSDQLADHYMTNLMEQFGDAVELSDEFRWEWISIPHFFQTPFYTYAYSFGQLLVLALYQQYRSQGAAFIPKYLKILSSGGSASPMKTLSEAGIDITKAEFWQGGFDVLAGMIQLLETD